MWLFHREWASDRDRRRCRHVRISRAVDHHLLVACWTSCLSGPEALIATSATARVRANASSCSLPGICGENACTASRRRARRVHSIFHGACPPRNSYVESPSVNARLII